MVWNNIPNNRNITIQRFLAVLITFSFVHDHIMSTPQSDDDFSITTLWIPCRWRWFVHFSHLWHPLQVRVTCPPGHVISDDIPLSCTETGEWSRPVPSCNLPECPDISRDDVVMWDSWDGVILKAGGLKPKVFWDYDWPSGPPFWQLLRPQAGAKEPKSLGP